MGSASPGWTSRARAGLGEVAGEEGAASIEAQWDELGREQTPVVTLFGSYDSGKSTLLKRLLVDAGGAVPTWLTVSARRETFEISEVDAFGCRFRDTPGIAGGNPDHQRVAAEAVSLTDAILLVVPPQLITGDRDAVVAVATGK